MKIETVTLSFTAPIAIDNGPNPSTLGACDLKGRCYWGHQTGRVWRWKYWHEPHRKDTHWLPANAVALPIRVFRQSQP